MHRLSDIDLEELTGTCEECGRTRVYKVARGGVKCSKGAVKSTNLHRLTDVDREAGWGTCAECGPVRLKLVDGGFRVYCSHSAMLSRSRLNALNSGGYHPLVATKAELDAAILEQQGRCAICSKATPDLVPDHCHSTGRFRGWLCSNCNVGGGMFKDDPDLLRAASDFYRLA